MIKPPHFLETGMRVQWKYWSSYQMKRRRSTSTILNIRTGGVGIPTTYVTLIDSVPTRCFRNPKYTMCCTAICAISVNGEWVPVIVDRSGSFIILDLDLPV
jgi:hypothetical protein